MDILLNHDGDLYISQNGDICLEASTRQKIMIRLRWLESEWRWNREEGLPYFDSLLIKNPDIEAFESAVREKIFEVDEVTDVKEVSITFDNRTRQARLFFVAETDLETIKGEVVIQCLITG